MKHLVSFLSDVLQIFWCTECILLVLCESVDCYGQNKAVAFIREQKYYNILMLPTSWFHRRMYPTITSITLLFLHHCCPNMNVDKVIFGELCPRPPSSAPTGVRWPSVWGRGNHSRPWKVKCDAAGPLGCVSESQLHNELAELGLHQRCSTPVSVSTHDAQ